jgi:hypothetical protein
MQSCAFGIQNTHAPRNPDELNRGKWVPLVVTKGQKVTMGSIPRDSSSLAMPPGSGQQSGKKSQSPMLVLMGVDGATARSALDERQARAGKRVVEAGRGGGRRE